MILKEYRKRKKLSVEKFSKLMKVSTSTVKRWESKFYAPTLYEAIRICDILNLPFTKLYKEYKEVE